MKKTLLLTLAASLLMPLTALHAVYAVYAVYAVGSGTYQFQSALAKTAK